MGRSPPEVICCLALSLFRRYFNIGVWVKVSVCVSVSFHADVTNCAGSLASHLASGFSSEVNGFFPLHVPSFYLTLELPSRIPCKTHPTPSLLDKNSTGPHICVCVLTLPYLTMKFNL